MSLQGRNRRFLSSQSRRISLRPETGRRRQLLRYTCRDKRRVRGACPIPLPLLLVEPGREQNATVQQVASRFQASDHPCLARNLPPEAIPIQSETATLSCEDSLQMECFLLPHDNKGPQR